MTPAPSGRTRFLLLLALLVAAVLMALPSALLAQEAITANRSGDFANRPTRVATAVRTGDGLVGATQRQLVMQWDGTAEEGYSLNVGPGQEPQFVQRYSLPESTGTIGIVTTCFFFDLPVDNFSFEVLVHRNSGGVPTTTLADEQFEVAGTLSGDLCLESDLALPVSAQQVFVGVRFPALDGVFLGIDEDGPFTSPAFARVDSAEPWDTLQSFGSAFSGFRNLALEFDFITDDPPPPTDTCPTTACVEDGETLCLLNDRFRMTADFRDISGASGAAKAGINITPDTGYFHFPGFPDNVEVVGKMIDACQAFDSFWFFAAGLTDQEFTLEVCDTQTGTMRTYFSPLSTKFETITDTAAFATCP